MNAQGTMRIGEVHAILRRDLPDIELSKIRYYEDKGLVRPTRSRKGYRLYSERDVACLREAIRLANEEFVPLRVVRIRLIEQGLLDDERSQPTNVHVARSSGASVISMPAPDTAPPAPVGDAAESLVPPVVAPRTAPREVSGADDERERNLIPVEELVPPASTSSRTPAATLFSAQEFLVESGLTPPTLNAMIASGLLRPRVVAQQNTFDELDLKVARSAAVLLARGVDVRFLGSLRRNVEREIGLLNDVTQPLRVPSQGRSIAQSRDTARAVGSELEALRVELFRRALKEYLGD